ncbi:MAG: helix-turn-helix transcriptional regulator [Mycobacterium sp.]
MAAPVLSRPVECRAIDDFLASASVEPTALMVEGEAGIGKTTLWLAAVDQGCEKGFRVLSARPAAAESVLAYASLADMLNEVDPDAWAELPEPQRVAIDRVLLRAKGDGNATDQRAVAAAFLSVIKGLADQTPVLLAIDDLQWLDASSMQIIGFAARRLSGRVGVLGTVRTEPDGPCDTSWLQLPGPGAVQRIALGPLSLGGIREVVSERLGREVSRHAIVRIHEVSQGNPFYAIELARVMDDDTPSSEVPLPATLTELVRTRIGSLGADVQNVLLAASCVPAPTVELMARTTGHDEERLVGLLAVAEDKGIVTIDGHRLHFTHPLLARGVYSEATAAQRRNMHRRLADVVEEPELQARHLAMAVAWGDPNTLKSLDRAAELARARGAPAAAAELLDLAIRLGGDTAERRILLAANHFDAGNAARARVLLEETIAALEPGILRAQALSLLGPVRIFDDSFVEGVAAMERSLDDAPDDLALRVPTLITMLIPLFNTGELVEASRRAEDAVTDATRLGHPLLLSQAISLRVFLRFLRGDGLDEPSLRSALEMEDRYTGSAIPSGFQVIVRPCSHHAILLSWSGQLERAHKEMLFFRRNCIEHGLEHEWIYATYYSVQLEIWRANFGEAAELAEQGMERALQIGGEVSIGGALTWRAALAAYAGNQQQADSDANAALAAMQRCGAHMLERWPIAITGFLNVSMGDYAAALATLEPLLSSLDMDATEIYLAEFVPDAVEAMVHLGRLDDAEPFVDALERNGRRLDRPWMLAVGARCRSMLLAARGDVDAATVAAQAALTHHERLPMPFDRARSQLLLGQLQRRQRRRDAATVALREALTAFEAMGTPLWADRARAELDRTTAGHDRSGKLTVSERRVAELAASGMTNRDVAAALFISPKTVEANLARVYRKLDIHSRAELGRMIARAKT